MEAAAISQTRPSLNGVDRAGRFQPHVAASAKSPRRRPQQNQRTPGLEPLWVLPVVVKKLLGVDQALVDHGPQDAYESAYVAAQRDYGLAGPLMIFQPRFTILCLLYLAKRSARMVKPSNWTVDQWATWLYELADALVKISSALRRQTIGAKLDTILNLWKLPPRYIPPIVVPWGVSRQGVQLLKSCVHHAVANVRSQASRQWLRDHTKFVKGKMRRWSETRNVGKMCSQFQAAEFASMDHSKLGQLRAAVSLKACEGNWMLPVFPDNVHAFGELHGAVNRWCQRCRLKPKSTKASLRWFRAQRDVCVVKDIPPQWHDSQVRLRAQHQAADTLIGDDKDKAKSWQILAPELHALLVEQTLLRNTSWSIAPDSDPESLTAQVRQTCINGLPSWLRKGRGNKESGSNQPPRLFCSVKSKCFDDSGKHTCTKPHHSCLRRILDFSKYPFRTPWKLVARALDVILSAVSCGVGVASLKDLGPRIKQLAHSQSSHSVCQCLRCQAPIQGWNLATADIDQAFEACGGVDLEASLIAVERAFLDKYPEGFVSVRKGQQVSTRIGQYWSAGFICLHVSVVVKAIRVFASVVLCSFGTLVLRMRGLPIGAIPSAASVNTLLDHYETSFLHSDDRKLHARFDFLSMQNYESYVLWVRYVDDLLLGSKLLCSACLLDLARAVYPMDLSVTSGRSGDPNVHMIADIQVLTSAQGLDLLLKNPNRPFLASGSPRVQTSTVPWPGAIPSSFGHIRGRIIGLISRCRQVHSNDYFTLVRVIEYLWELKALGYPVPLLKKLVFSLPASVLAQRLRHFACIWFGVDACPSGAVRGHDFLRRPQRDRSSSSSRSSSVDRTEEKVARCRKLLVKYDQQYAEYIKEQEVANERKHVASHGLVLAEALRPALQAALSGVAPTPEAMGEPVTTPTPG